MAWKLPGGAGQARLTQCPCLGQGQHGGQVISRSKGASGNSHPGGQLLKFLQVSLD
jgi:hypothetical protein